MKKSGSPKSTRNVITENFRRRRNTVMKNTDKLCRDFGCEGYVLLKRNGKLFTYTSSNRSGWPFSTTEVDQSYPLAQRYTPSSFRSKSRTTREGTESDKAI